jgi:hypothetical protein
MGEEDTGDNRTRCLRSVRLSNPTAIHMRKDVSRKRFEDKIPRKLDP